MNADEVLAKMDMLDANEVEIQYIIDENLRVISIPPLGVVLGVEGDKDVNSAKFKMVRYYKGIDLSKFEIRINFANANGDLSYYTVKNPTVTDDTLTFEWLVGYLVTKYKGTVRFVVRMITTDASTGEVQQAFDTTVGEARSLEGLLVDTPTDEKVYDIVAQLKADLTDHVNNLLETIPEDYSELTKKVEDNTSGISELKNIKTCKNILFKGTTNIVDGEFVDLDGTVTSDSHYMHTERIAMPYGSKLFGIGKRASDGYLETLSMRFVSAYINGRYNTYYGKANATEYECHYGDGVEVTVSINKGTYTDFYLYVISDNGTSINPINETLKGKTVYGFGDSLVYGHYSKVGMLDMLCDNEGMIYKKYAVNGAKITGQWEILKQIILGDTEQPDFVIFDGGTNDAFTSSPIGEFSEEYTSQGYDTFIGAFDTVCNNIRVKYPNAKIIYVSPHKMPTSSFEIQKTIHDMALKVCDKYSISVVDIYSQGQINTNIETMKNEWSYNTEGATSGGNGTHLTGEGYYKFYAPMIKAKMIELLD